MSTNESHPARKTWRIWPGLLIISLSTVAFLSAIFLFPHLSGIGRTRIHFMTMLLSPVLGAVLTLTWWVTYSRVQFMPRLLVPALFVIPGVMIAGWQLSQGETPMIIIFGIPAILTFWGIWLLLSHNLDSKIRASGLYALLLMSWILLAVLRIDGTDADIVPTGLAWRWNMKPEDLVKDELAGRKLVSASTPVPVAVASTDAGEFRGPERNGVVRGISIATDWTVDPPVELWKQKIGPGWGSFSVVGDRAFTQEQRGDQEAVVCYDAKTGGEIWRHFEKTKFTEPIAGAGPRATPTVNEGKVYAQGATGLLLCLKAEDGSVVWKTDVREKTNGVVPQWGYASSPLLGEGLIFVYTGGEHQGTSAFSAATGEWKWSAGEASHSYSSAQFHTIAGVRQVLLLSNYGLESFDPPTGKVLWEHRWEQKEVNRVTQPTVIAEGEFLIGTGVGNERGTRRIKVTQGKFDWNVQQKWVSEKVRPYFNDGVVHRGHFYGYDDKSLICMNLDDGSVKWNAGTVYGHGQVLLLADQDLLLVQAVDGKVYLVKADPADHVVESKFNALVGKTWSHPVIANGKLFVRNAVQAAAYELKMK